MWTMCVRASDMAGQCGVCSIFLLVMVCDWAALQSTDCSLLRPEPRELTGAGDTSWRASRRSGLWISVSNSVKILVTRHQYPHCARDSFSNPKPIWNLFCMKLNVTDISPKIADTVGL